MITKTETSPALVDAHARILANKALANEITQEEARWGIASALLTLDIPAWVAARTPNIDIQLRHDLTEKLQELIENKCLDAERGLDLKQVPTTSASGWARNLARSAVEWTVIDLRRKGSQAIPVSPIVDTTELGSAGMDYAAAAFHGLTTAEPSTVTPEEDDDLHDIAEEFSAAALGARSSRRLRLSASYLLSTYGLPELIRPNSILDREWIRQQIDSAASGETAAEKADRESLARRSVAALRSLVTTTESPADRVIDDRLLSLWDNYTVEEMELLSSKPAAVANTLVMAVVSPKSRPNRDVIAHTLHTLRMADQDEDTRGFDRFTRGLLNSWVASECAAVSDFDTKGTAAKEAAHEEALRAEAAEFPERAAHIESQLAAIKRARDEKEAARFAVALEWPVLAAAAAARPGHPFGNSVDAVDQFITGIVEALSA